MSGFSAPRDATTPAGSRRARRLVTSLALVAAVGLLPACDGGDRATNPADEAVFLLRACRGSIEFPEGRTFRILTRKLEVVAQGTSLVGAGNVKIVHGLVATGPGGFNAPWQWHLVPESVQFVDLAMELCDVCPLPDHAVQRWIETVGYFCPWSTEVLRRER